MFLSDILKNHTKTKQISTKPCPIKTLVNNLPWYVAMSKEAQQAPSASQLGNKIGPPRRIPRRVRDQDGYKTVLYIKMAHSPTFKMFELGTHDITYVDALCDSQCPDTFWERYKLECAISQKKGLKCILWDIQEEGQSV